MTTTPDPNADVHTVGIRCGNCRTVLLPGICAIPNCERTHGYADAHPHSQLFIEHNCPTP